MEHSRNSPPRSRVIFTACFPAVISLPLPRVVSPLEMFTAPETWTSVAEVRPMGCWAASKGAAANINEQMNGDRITN